MHCVWTVTMNVVNISKVDVIDDMIVIETIHIIVSVCFHIVCMTD